MDRFRRTMEEKTVARNEPCPCGSGKKYKRCHGMDAAPKLTTSSAPVAPAGAEAGAMPGGLDPSKMDQAAMMQVMQAMQRLPRGQLQRLQGLVQKAMAGKDVSREMAEFERTLPPNFQSLMASLAPQLMPGMMQQMAGAQAAAAPAAERSEDEAKRIVAEAAKSGKIAADQAAELLGDSAAEAGDGADAAGRGSKFSRLWKSMKRG